jgi:hypothetical protein
MFQEARCCPVVCVFVLDSPREESGSEDGEKRYHRFCFSSAIDFRVFTKKSCKGRCASGDAASAKYLSISLSFDISFSLSLMRNRNVESYTVSKPYTVPKPLSHSTRS